MTIGQDRPGAHEVPYPTPTPTSPYPTPMSPYPPPYPAEQVAPHPASSPWDVVEPLAVPREVIWTKWLWLFGGVGIVAAGGILMAAYGVNVITELVLALTVVVAALAVSAALRLPSGARWARAVLVTLAAMSLGSTYRSVLHGMWPALVLNVPLAASYFLLRASASKAFFAAAGQRRA